MYKGTMQVPRLYQGYDTNLKSYVNCDNASNGLGGGGGAGFLTVGSLCS